MMLGAGACVSREPTADIAQAAPGSQLRQPEACPRCGGTHILPILYGLLAEPGEQRVRDGKAVSGGCEISREHPDWSCQTCAHRWYDATDPYRKAWWDAHDRELQEIMERFKAGGRLPNKT